MIHQHHHCTNSNTQLKNRRKKLSQKKRIEFTFSEYKE